MKILEQIFILNLMTSWLFCILYANVKTQNNLNNFYNMKWYHFEIMLNTCKFVVSVPWYNCDMGRS